MSEPPAEASESAEDAEGDLTSPLSLLFGTIRGVVEAIIRPLRRGEGPNKFRLSTAETATTTYDGDVGWAKRPPAMLQCPRCGDDVLQHRARNDIDCPRCIATRDYDEFPDLELQYLICPVCRNRMQHGRRHPERFDVPEWATCNACRYHWEFKHSYS